MANRVGVAALVFVLIVASALLFVVQAAPLAPAESKVPSGPAVSASATSPTFYYNYSDFFNVPYGQWWDLRTNAKYGDEPIGASCFNATSTTDGTCTTAVPGIPRVAQYPYEDWSGPGAATAIYAPYRVSVNGLYAPGYNLSQPVFLPVLNYSAPAGNTLSFNLNMQYLNVADYAALTSSPLSCYAASGANANDGYQLRTRIFLTMDNQEAARLFGAQSVGTQQQLQNWWNSRVNSVCGGTKTAVGPLETTVNNWFQTEANGKYDIYNGYAGAYLSLYTNMTATVLSPGPTGTTQIYLEHGAWGTEILLDRWFYWGNATYAGNQADSSKAKGWWGMENGWWEGVKYAGKLQAATMNFNLTGVLQFHFQEHSLAGADGVWHTADDTPYWTWGPQLVDYVASAGPHPNSEMDRYAGLNYLKTTPGSGDYGTNSSFDYTPIAWPAKTGETWKFVFPLSKATYYQNPATAVLGTNLPATQLPAMNSTLSLLKLFPAGYGTWNALTGTWTVIGGTPVTWPTGTPGSYPYIPYPGIYLQPGGIPPTVSTVAASGVTTSAATLNGNLAALGSAASVTVGFLWGTSPTLVGATNVTVGAHAVGAFSSALSSLTPGTTYYFRAWGNGDGFATGSILSFTTGTTPPSVITDAASAITTTAATLNGHTTALGTAVSVAVGFLWGTSPTLVGAANVSAGTQTIAGAFSSSVTTLSPGTTYYFQAWASGQGFVKGSIVSFLTSSTPPTVVTDAATSIGTTTATLNGHTTGLGTATTVSVGFLYGTSPTLVGATNVTVTTQTVIGAFSSPRAGLLPGTTYYFQAWANGQGFAKGSILSFTTAVTPPSVTTNAASGITTTAATLNGATTSLGTATSVTVGFLWGTSPSLSGAANVSAGTQTVVGAFSSPLTGLTPGTTYYFRAWANGNGFATGSILSFQTGVTPPSVVTDAASGISTSAATLNGHTTSLGTASSVGVGFLWGTSPTLSGAANISVTTQTVAGAFSTPLTTLGAGTTYYFQAWASGAGFVKGLIVSFTTSVTPPIVVTDAASAITTSAATLNGHTTSLGTAASVGVGFLWGTSPTLAGAVNVTVTTQTVAGSFSSPLTSLAGGTTYFFQAWANGQGFAKGSILSFTTGTTPPSVVTDPASGIAATAATLNGHTTSLGTAASVTVGFLWGTSPTLAGATNVTVTTQTVPGSFLDALTGLTAATTYYFQAWALGAGFAQGSILSFTTGTTPPSVVTDAASAVGTTTATLNGHTTSLGTAASVTVGFLWGTSSTLSGAANVSAGTQTVPGAFSSPLTGLTPGTTYYFQAWALGAGFAHGAILSFTAGVTPPTVQTNPASGITTTAATLNGATTSLGTAVSVTVGFLWGTSPTLTGAANVSAGTQSVAGAFTSGLTGLAAGTTYYFQAWANGQGFAKGSVLSFTTAVTPPSVTTNAASGITTTAATLNGATTSLGTATSVTVGFLWGTSPTLVGAANVTVTTQTAPGSFLDGLTSLAPGTTYYFQAWANGQGFAKGSILSFTTGTTPPSVVTNPASGITTTTATLNGATTSLGTAGTVSVGFLWGTSPTLAGATNASAGSQTVAGAFSIPITALSPGTTYYFQAWALGAGFAHGAILSFTAGVSPPVVQTNPASGITTSGATLNGATTDLGTAASVTVGFLYGTSPALVGAANVTVATQSAVGSFTFDLTGLAAGTTYFFQAWANGQGFAKGSILSFTTGTTPPSVVTDPASGIATTAATLNGHTTSLGTATSVTVGFLWGTSPALSGAANVTMTTQTAPGSFLDGLTSLAPGTTYYFQAWAFGQGFVKGSILSFTTGTTPPSVVTNPASAIATTSATLNGATSDLGTAASVSVGFLYGTDPSLAVAANASAGAQTVPGSFSFALTGLTPGTTYYFRAWALGHGFAQGVVLSFTTGVLPPVVQTNPASGVTSTAATLNGATTSLGTAASVTVGFLWGTSSILVGAANVTVTTQTVPGSFLDALTGLTPGTTYYFQAWALGAGFAQGAILSFTAGVTPPTVQTNPASGITTTAATLNGATTSLGTATSVTVGFLYGTSASLAGATNVTVTTQTAAGAFNYGLLSLTPSMTYYFQAWALGDGFATGGILSFTTETPTAAPVVVTDAASGITTSDAILNGHTTGLGTASSVTVGFLWGTSSTLIGATNVTAGTQTAMGPFTYPLTGLAPGTTYYFQAWALGDGFAAGAVRSFTTKIPLPPYCADLINRSAWAGIHHLVLSKSNVETLNAKVYNCGSNPVDVLVVFNVYDAAGNLVQTFTTDVYSGLAPGWNVTLTVSWEDPPVGKYTATAQAFYSPAGTAPSTPGATVKSFKFTVVVPKKGPASAVAGLSDNVSALLSLETFVADYGTGVQSSFVLGVNDAVAASSPAVTAGSPPAS